MSDPTLAAAKPATHKDQLALRVGHLMLANLALEVEVAALREQIAAEAAPSEPAKAAPKTPAS